MSAAGWAAIGLLGAWVCLCHINILILQRWVQRLGGGPLIKPGRCGHESPRLLLGPPVHCSLLAGHDGWHRGDPNLSGSAPEWSA